MRILVKIDTDFGISIHSNDLAHTGLVRLPDVPAHRGIALTAALIENNEEAFQSGAVVTFRGDRIRISPLPPITERADP